VTPSSARPRCGPVDAPGRARGAALLDHTLAHRRPALVCYLPLGDPLITYDLPSVLVDAGADVLEVGVPAVDPYRDGPVVAGSMRRARVAGVDHEAAVARVTELRAHVIHRPLVWMGYPEDTTSDWARAVVTTGVDAVLLAEHPHRLDASRRSLDAAGVPLLPFLGLDLDPADVAWAKRATTGYAMVQAVPGKTGVRPDGPDRRVPEVLEALRHAGVTVPLAVGFGVATPQAARVLAEMGADAVIVGSAVLEAALEGPGPVSCLVSALRRSLDRAEHP